MNKWFMFGLLIFNLIFFLVSWFLNDIREMLGFGIMLLFLTNILLVTKGK